MTTTENHVVYENVATGMNDKCLSSEWQALQQKFGKLVKFVYEGTKERCEACLESLNTVEA